MIPPTAAEPGPSRTRSPRGERQRPGAWDAFLWLRLFATLPLAMRGGRVALGLVLVLVLALCAHLPALWLGAEATPAARAAELAGPVVERLGESAMRFDLAGVVGAIAFLVIDVPSAAFDAQPWSTIATLVPMLLAWGVVGGAIVRASATEFATGERVSALSALSFTLGKGVSIAGALLTPLVLAGLAGAVLMGLGFLFRGPAFAQGLGGIAYGLFLLVGLLGVVALIGFALGLPLLVASVVCEGTDAIDGLQRAFAYVLGRPVRLVLYSLVLYGQLALFGVVLAAIAGGVLAFTERWAFAHAPEGAPPQVSAFASSAIGAWMLGVRALVAAGVVSFFHAGSAVLYLLVRQANDGQDPADLWQAGMPAGATAASKPAAPASDAEAIGDGDDD